MWWSLYHMHQVADDRRWGVSVRVGARLPQFLSSEQSLNNRPQHLVGMTGGYEAR